jgi:hypothetical protein
LAPAGGRFVLVVVHCFGDAAETHGVIAKRISPVIAPKQNGKDGEYRTLTADTLHLDFACEASIAAFR